MAAFGSVENRLPGRGAQAPSQRVEQFQNQQLAGLSTGTSSKVGQATSPSQSDMMPNSGPTSEAMTTLGRTQKAILHSSDKLVGYAQIQRKRIETEKAQAEQARQQALEAQKQANYMKSFSGGSRPMQAGNYGWQSSAQMVKGPAVNRVQSMLRYFPGLRITETHGDRNYDRAHGVPRRANSYHYDRRNPAVDIAGPPAVLDRLYRELVRQGGWRQILWRVPGHYNHIHVA